MSTKEIEYYNIFTYSAVIKEMSKMQREYEPKHNARTH